MEQQIYQQDQVGNPQMGQQQQMMLCPVRLVYESPMLVQPGDQMQQNQTIFINHQSTPPWARPVQNQVIYVQQLANNMVPMQQTLDPNLYVQHSYVNYPQLMPQQILNQNPQEQIRFPIQVPNMLPQSMVQNIQPNSSIQNVDERTMASVISNNYAHIQTNSSANVQNAIQNQFSAVNNRQMQNIVQPTNRNLNQNVVTAQTTLNMPQTVNQTTATIAPKAMETQKQSVYKNIGPQVNPQYVMIRPQVPQMMNQMQNVQNVQQVSQPFIPNVRQNIPMQPHNVVNSVQNVQTPINIRPNIQSPIERPVLPNTNVIRPGNSGATVSYTAVRNGQSYTYRALQPRPQSRNIPNLLPMGNQAQTQTQPQCNQAQTQTQPQIQRANNPNVNITGPDLNKSITDPPATNVNPIKTEFGQVAFNRKRKSESPDEIKKKIPASSTVYGNMTITAKPQANIPRNVTISNEIGVNTSPVHKMDNKPLINQSTGPQISPMESIENIIKKELNIKNIQQYNKILPSNIGVNTSPIHQAVNQPPLLQINPMESIQNMIKQEPYKDAVKKTEYCDKMPESSNVSNDKVKEQVKQTEKDKLVRNTVFTQARGRLFNDKNVLGNVINEQDVNKSEVVIIIKNTGSPKKDESVQTNNIEKMNATMRVEAMKSELKTNEITIKKEKNVKEKEPTLELDQTKMKTIKKEEITKEKDPTLELNHKNMKTIIKEEIIKVKKPTLEIKQTNRKIEKTISKLSAFIVKPKETNRKIKEPITKTTTDPTLKIAELNIETTKSTVKLNEAKVITDEVDIKPNDAVAKTNEQTAKDKSEKDSNDTKTGAKDKKAYKNLSANDMNGKEIHIVDGSVVKEDRDRVLTHVLDGYVIQESSVPFAIRKPLKEKTIYANTPLHSAQSQDIKQELMNSLKDSATKDIVPKDSVVKDSVTKDNVTKEVIKVNAEKDTAKEASKILEISNLNITEEKPKNHVQESDEKMLESDNPFGCLKHTVVKSWTIDHLASHLSKFNWSDTISILQDHEIDGESLFLVSKPQLITIGVSETHADVICEFVKS